MGVVTQSSLSIPHSLSQSLCYHNNPYLDVIGMFPPKEIKILKNKRTEQFNIIIIIMKTLFLN